MPSIDNMTVGFIGAGTLGSGLALALHGAGFNVTSVSSRTFGSAEALAQRVDGCAAVGTSQEVADRCDLVFITTPDSVIATVAGSIEWRAEQGVAHCCGAASIELLTAAERAGASVGAMHPFQTFAAIDDPSEAAARLNGVTFAVAANGWLTDTLPELARSLGGYAISIPDELRPLYHASAVLSCGYVATLLDAAAGLWTELGYTDEDGVRAIVPLVRATVEAVQRMGPSGAVTGPAVRGDAATIAAHLEALTRHAGHLSTLYRELTSASVPLARSKGVTDEQIEQLRRTLGGAG